MFVEHAKSLNTDLLEDMFIGDNPIFSGFIKCTQKYASENGVEKSFSDFGKNEYSVTVLKMSGKEYGQEDRLTFCTKYHLKKVKDLIGYVDFYNEY